MGDVYDPSTGPKTNSDLIELAKDVDFIQLVLVDLNGMPRIKIFPADYVKRLLQSGANTVICMMSFHADGTIPIIPEHADMHFGNIRIRPIVDTTRNWPWWNLSTNTSALQMFAYPEYLNGTPIECDPRTIALKQIKRLHDRGLDILCGTECEFRIFETDSGKPAHDTINLYYQSLITKYENIYVEINKRIRAVGFTYETFHTEYGSGQLELPLTAEWGIKSADDLVRFKMIARDVARESGYHASFMTKPMGDPQTGNGFHLNHSVWKRCGDSKPSENMMYDPEDGDKLSTFAREWLAGLLHHSGALTALLSPTVNCYRRLHHPWSPSFVDWGVEDRFASFRYKSSGGSDGVCLENRCPSSAVNPYLALAATIAAGLDGVDNHRPLVAGGSKDLGVLPDDLDQALEALRKDEELTAQLGSKFVEWFSCLKKEELKRLEKVNIKESREEDLKAERELFFDYV